MAPDPTPSDRTLLARYCDRRDDAAFAAIVARHQPMVRAVCRRIAGEAELDDAVQAVFLVLALRARGLRGRHDLGGWLHLAARHVALRQRAAAHARRRREAAAATPVVSAPPAEPDPFLAHLDAALDRLPETLRQPIVLHYLEGLPADTVAARLGLAPKALGMRLTRARRRLRDLLERLGARVEPAALTALLTALAVNPDAPHAATGAAAAKGGSALGAAGDLAREVAAALAWAKVKLVAVTTAAVLAAALAVGGGALAVDAIADPDTPGMVRYRALADIDFVAPATVAADGRLGLSEEWTRLLQLDPQARARTDQTLQSAYHALHALLSDPPPTVARPADQTWILSWSDDRSRRARAIHTALEEALLAELGRPRWRLLARNFDHARDLLHHDGLPTEVRIERRDEDWVITTARGPRRGVEHARRLPDGVRPLLSAIPELTAYAVPASPPQPLAGIPGPAPTAIAVSELLHHPVRADMLIGGSAPRLSPAARTLLALSSSEVDALEAALERTHDGFVAVLAHHPPTVTPWRGDGHELVFADLTAPLAPLRAQWRRDVEAVLEPARAAFLLAAAEADTQRLFWGFGETLQTVRLRKTGWWTWESGFAYHWSDGDGGTSGGSGESAGNLPPQFEVFRRFQR